MFARAIAVEEALRAAGKEAPAACVRVAQMGEKTKLNMTCTLQVLRKRIGGANKSWQAAETDGSPDGPGSIDVAELDSEGVVRGGGETAADRRRAVAAPTATSARHRRSTASSSIAAACAAIAQAARAAERRGATSRAPSRRRRVALEEAVRGINDALEELRYELEDEE